MTQNEQISSSRGRFTKVDLTPVFGTMPSTLDTLTPTPGTAPTSVMLHLL